MPRFVVLGAAAVVLVVYFDHKKWKPAKEQEQEPAFYELVDKFLDVVRDAAENGEDYISIPHVRDIICIISYVSIYHMSAGQE
ncbi:hypothetical protein ANCCAN_09422, partial [Ancylostoma caninum]